jgi:hypothetical protein
MSNQRMQCAGNGLLGTEVQDGLSGLNGRDELLQDFTEDGTGGGVLGQAVGKI